LRIFVGSLAKRRLILKQGVVGAAVGVCVAGALPGAAWAVPIGFSGTVSSITLMSGPDTLAGIVSVGSAAGGSFTLPDVPLLLFETPSSATYCCASPPIDVTLGGLDFAASPGVPVLNDDIDVLDDVAGRDAFLYSYAAWDPLSDPNLELFALRLEGNTSVLSSTAMPSGPAVLNRFGSREIQIQAVVTGGRYDISVGVDRFSTPIPEPSAWLAFGAGLAVVATVLRRRRS
jgi:hypothetical protein